MTVTEKEYHGMWKEIDGITFTPEATLIVKEDEVEGVKEKVFTYEILKPTDEVYQESLKPLTQKPTLEERVASAEEMLTMLMGV